MALDNLKALSADLADKPYFMGDQPMRLDATAYCFLSEILWPPPYELPFKVKGGQSSRLSPGTT